MKQTISKMKVAQVLVDCKNHLDSVVLPRYEHFVDIAKDISRFFEVPLDLDFLEADDSLQHDCISLICEGCDIEGQLLMYCDEDGHTFIEAVAGDYSKVWTLTPCNAIRAVHAVVENMEEAK
jgi:hypothetical protein